LLSYSRYVRISGAPALVLLVLVLISLAAAAPVQAAALAVSGRASGMRPVPPGVDPSPAHGATFLQMLQGGRLAADETAAHWPQGVDVSSSQHSNGARINWPQVGSGGYSFALIKATEGNYYVNPYFAGDFSTAKSSGLYPAGYHFAIPSASGGTSQADFFLEIASRSGEAGTLPPAVDLEWNPYNPGEPCYGLGSEEMINWIADFRNEVQRRTHRLPAIYTSASWWNQCTGGDPSFSADPLWVAMYDVSEPVLPAGWGTWALWQFTSTGVVPGIEGEVDVSNFVGRGGDLPNFASTPTAAPAPVPRPA
jgi:GH25 family lysozyme M1 (1,4-beta-N-acetylmuramidase)